MSEDAWSVYVLISTTAARTYVGISVDVERRLTQHNGQQPGGAKSTRAGRPWEIGAVYGPFADRSQATQVEHAVKRLTGLERLSWEPPSRE